MQAGNFAVNDKLIIYGVALGALALLFLPTVVINTATGAVNDVLGGAADILQKNSPLPDTRTPENKTRCQLALENGNDWEASFYCPASDWLSGVFDGK